MNISGERGGKSYFHGVLAKLGVFGTKSWEQGEGGGDNVHFSFSI